MMRDNIQEIMGLVDSHHKCGVLKETWLRSQIESKLCDLEKNAARWREVLTNDAFVVCNESGAEYRKNKLEEVVDNSINSDRPSS